MTQSEIASPNNTEQLTIYQKKFFANSQFVGQIYGRNKWRVNEFITKLNEENNTSTRIYWRNNKMQHNGNTNDENNFDYKPHWVVTSTCSEDMNKAVDWLVDSELECWKNRAVRRVTKEHVFTTNATNTEDNSEEVTQQQDEGGN